MLQPMVKELRSFWERIKCDPFFNLPSISWYIRQITLANVAWMFVWFCWLWKTFWMASKCSWFHGCLNIKSRKFTGTDPFCLWSTTKVFVRKKFGNITPRSTFGLLPDGNFFQFVFSQFFSYEAFWWYWTLSVDFQPSHLELEVILEAKSSNKHATSILAHQKRS